MECLGDYLSEFARPRGAKDKRPRRRRAREAGVATAAIGGGTVVGAKAGDRAAGQAYKMAVDKTYSSIRSRTGGVLPKRIAKNHRASISGGLRRFAEKGMRLGLNRGGSRLSTGQRLGLSAIARPGRTGAIVGGLAGTTYVAQRALRRRDR